MQPTTTIPNLRCRIQQKGTSVVNLAKLCQVHRDTIYSACAGMKVTLDTASKIVTTLETHDFTTTVKRKPIELTTIPQLREKMKAKGFSNMSLADRSGVCHSTIQRACDGVAVKTCIAGWLLEALGE